MTKKGWTGEKQRHGMARRGMKTVSNSSKYSASGQYDLPKANESEVRKRIEERLENAKFNLEMYYKIRQILEKFQGKSFSKRLATAVEKEFGPLGYTIYWKSEYGSNYIYVWKKSYQDKFEIHVGYSESNVYPDTFDIKTLDDINQRHILEKRRIPIYKKTLQNLKSLVNEYNAIVDTYDKFCKKTEEEGIHYYFGKK